MWPNLEKSGDWVTFTEEILTENFISDAVGAQKLSNFPEQLLTILVR